jgi:hypothetical protein
MHGGFFYILFCHPERSEGSYPASISPRHQILRCAQDDNLAWPKITAVGADSATAALSQI